MLITSYSDENKFGDGRPLEEIYGIVDVQDELELVINIEENQKLILTFDDTLYDFSQGEYQLTLNEKLDFVNKFKPGEKVLLKIPYHQLNEEKVEVNNVMYIEESR